MNDPNLAWLEAIRLAVTHETRRGYRDDCKSLVDGAWLKVLQILDERYQLKTLKKAKK